MLRRPLLLALLVWVADATRPPEAVAGRGEPWIHLETRACFGVCPVYTLRVSRDGQVSFEGQKFVIHPGARRRRLGKSDLVRLQKAVDASGFAGLSPQCCDCRERTDHPWTIVEIVKDGAAKTIEHYHGCRSAPPAMATLEDAIVSISGALRWIGTPEQRGRRPWARGR
jgi:hypothetical protein